MNPEAKLAQLGLKLPPAPQPAGLYKPLLVVGNIARVSGHGPLKADGTWITGQVGAELGPRIRKSRRTTSRTGNSRHH